MRILFILFIVVLSTSCSISDVNYRQKIDLQGEWQFSLDTAKIGEKQKWYGTDLNDTILLPGTTDLNYKGFQNKDTTSMRLNRIFKYEGIAWYRKKIIIPESFKDKYIQLFLERTKSTKIWIDSTWIGSSHILQSPQTFDVSVYLTPGTHYITVQIDNDLKLTPFGSVHIYSDDTQTNWNGIIGEMYIEAAEKTHISDLQIYPDIENNKVDIVLGVDNPLKLEKLDIDLLVEKTVNGKTTRYKAKKSIIDCQPANKLSYEFEDIAELWDEYEQPIYKLTAVISSNGIKDSKTVPFSMRKFAVAGTQFTINGRTTYLRGKHDAAVFPLTGFPPTDVEGWVRVYKIAKSYGINHYRFHSYCPPEAAFTAADQEGIYLQAELPFWGGLEADSIAQMLTEEGYAMLKAYANHPSFVMFSAGNEIWGGHDKVEKMMKELKNYDNRPLYTMGSNNNIGYEPPHDYCDFFVGARIPNHGDSILGHTRLIHGFCDAWNGGIMNTQSPSTTRNFDYAVSHMNLPVVSHEIGQYQIYPDYNEINKYTGVLKAWNLEVFQERLKKAGMTDLDSIFHKATGAWSSICYKAEMETAIRTKGMAGFQLLDLQDYPGQGTALVGILDAFMDSKNVITAEAWKQSCNDVVILLEFPKYCWTNNEDFRAKVVVANYSNKTIENSIHWEVRHQNGEPLVKGNFLNLNMVNGGLDSVGVIKAKLSSIKKSEKLDIFISIPGTEYSNSYPLWVYPSEPKLEMPEDILVTEELTSQVLSKLQGGAKVLLFPQTEDVRNNSYPGLFPPEFWNYGMFKGISEWLKKPVSPGTLSILTNPEHPVFNSFPTDIHTNWQWFSIIKASNSLILDNISDQYFPIVQVIDNLERNHKLGLIFEFKVGKGKLLVCMSQLNKLNDKPEAVQLYQSIINYMLSADFNPEYEISSDQLKELVTL